MTSFRFDLDNLNRLLRLRRLAQRILRDLILTTDPLGWSSRIQLLACYDRGWQLAGGCCSGSSWQWLDSRRRRRVCGQSQKCITSLSCPFVGLGLHGLCPRSISLAVGLPATLREGSGLCITEGEERTTPAHLQDSEVDVPRSFLKSIRASPW